MSTLWRKTLLYLGLVDEEDVEQAASGPASQSQVRTVRQAGPPQGGLPGRRVEPPAGTRRRVSIDPSHAEAGIRMREPGGIRPVPAGEAHSEIVVAREFNDAQAVADRLRDRLPVVLDLRETEPDMVRRLIDFASGLTYALDGTMRKIGQGIILVLPHRMVLSRDERRRLTDMGLYEAPDEDGP